MSITYRLVSHPLNNNIMNQLSFDFGPEHPKNVKRVNTGILISRFRVELPDFIATSLLGVQPMTAPSGAIFTLKPRYTPIPSPDMFVLTESPSDHDFEWGCFGKMCRE